MKPSVSILWQNIGCFPTPATNFPILWTPTRCPKIQFNFDTKYLELVSDSTDLRVQSHKTAPTSDTSLKSWAIRTSGILIPQPSTPGIIELWAIEWLIELRETLMFVSLLLGYNSGKPAGKDIQDKVWGVGTQNFHALSGHPTLLAP